MPALFCRRMGALAVIAFGGLVAAHGVLPPDPELDARIEAALAVARDRMADTVAFLELRNAAETNPARKPYYPGVTENLLINPAGTRPDGEWSAERADGSFWAKGAFAALLWMMAECEPDSAQRLQWQAWARQWSEPLRGFSGGDMTVNNHAVFSRWLEQAAGGADAEAQRQALLAGARRLATPYDRATDTGVFHEDIGVMGYKRKADTTRVEWFHAFADHIPNVEQLLAASWLADDPAEALDWRGKAVRHILTLAGTVGPNRNPGTEGTWQRGYFDWNTGSPTYGQFLFNEGKQGWSHASTWSRGQAWWVYGSALAYHHTRHPRVLAAARAAAGYYQARLPDSYPGGHRQPGLFVPAWDFDYAWQVSFATEPDTSAAAIALAGLVRLAADLPEDDPDHPRLLEVLRGTLLNLTAEPFLNTGGLPRMSILLRGCYHHFACLYPGNYYSNGLIWGDYFLVDALLAYRAFRDNPPQQEPEPSLAIAPAGSAAVLGWDARPGFIYQIEESPDLDSWEDAGLPVWGMQQETQATATVDPAAGTRFWRLRSWPQPAR